MVRINNDGFNHVGKSTVYRYDRFCVEIQRLYTCVVHTVPKLYDGFRAVIVATVTDFPFLFVSRFTDNPYDQKLVMK